MSVELENVEFDAAQSEPDNRPAEAEVSAGKRVDFRHPVFLSSAEWRKIRFEMDEFAEALGALLSTYFRADFGIQVSRLETAPFGDFIAALPPATHLTLLKLDPLRGSTVLEVRHGLALAIIDRVLGGPGQLTGLERNLTEMEIALMDQVVQLILSEWCKQWKRFQDLRPEIVGHENNPRFLQSCGNDTVMIVLTLEARLAESVGTIQMAVPYHSFEGILGQLIETATPAPAPPPTAPTLKWNRNLETVRIELSAQWPSFKLSARELLNLKVGELLPLQAQAVDAVELRVGRTPKFLGRLGTRDKKWAIQITEVSRL